MAEVTYYFDVKHVSTDWEFDPEYMVDGILTNYASSDSYEEQLLTGNTCPGTNLGTITKVELRWYAYGDGGDYIRIWPEFTGGTGDLHAQTPGTGPPGAWSNYEDITTDTNAGDWSAWSQVQDLDCDIRRVSSGKSNLVYCAKVEIRVTYTTGAAWTQVQYTSEPPTPNAWNQVKHAVVSGWNQIKYGGE